MSIVKNLPLLMNSVWYAYNRGLPNPDGSKGDFQPIINKETGEAEVTYCNQAIQYICNCLGYDKFNGLNANQIVRFMADVGSGWISVDDQNAQIHANAGILVIAGWANPNGHGHVAVLIPGLLDKSINYGKAVPKCVNIGRDVFIGKRISFAFPPEMTPTYYALCEMI